MLLVTSNDYILNQDKYDSIVNQVNLTNISCPHCHHKGLHRMGTYERSMENHQTHEVFKLTVQRVRCPHCGHTHALFCGDMIPYVSISVLTCLIVINLGTITRAEQSLQRHEYLNHERLRRILRTYNHSWKHKLNALNLNINSPNLQSQTSKLCNHIFMQNHRGNIFHMTR